MRSFETEFHSSSETDHNRRRRRKIEIRSTVHRTTRTNGKFIRTVWFRVCEQCVFPSIQIVWYSKNTVLEPSNDVHIDQSRDVHMFISILTIDRVTADYDGKIKVMIKNELGDAVSTTQVNVKRRKWRLTVVLR
ncbi:MAG: hypothetical protein HC794_01700 [Nitrospiraceae bacterium]|nr:hypothetical protein [Nitrospiraceae bacterium]